MEFLVDHIEEIHDTNGSKLLRCHLGLKDIHGIYDFEGIIIYNRTIKKTQWKDIPQKGDTIIIDHFTYTHESVKSLWNPHLIEISYYTIKTTCLENT